MYYLFIRITYPINRVIYPDKKVKQFHYKFRALLFTALPAGSLQKFSSPVKAAAFTKAAFIKQPGGGGKPQGLINQLFLYLIILFLSFSPYLAFFFSHNAIIAISAP